MHPKHSLIRLALCATLILPSPLLAASSSCGSSSGSSSSGCGSSSSSGNSDCSDALNQACSEAIKQSCQDACNTGTQTGQNIVVGVVIAAVVVGLGLGIYYWAKPSDKDEGVKEEKKGGETEEKGKDMNLYPEEGSLQDLLPSRAEVALARP